jgi:hypothetical protein
MYNKFIIKELGRNSFTVYNKETKEYQGYYTSAYVHDILDLLSIINKTDYTLSLILKYLDSRTNEIKNTTYVGDDESVELVRLLDDARLDELKTLKKRIANEVLELTLLEKK